MLTDLFLGKMSLNITMIESAEKFVRLRNSSNKEEYSIAANEVATFDVWLAIISKYEDMKEWVVLNKKVPVEILEILSKDINSKVRFCVAQKRKLTEEILLRLANDNDESVRLAIARNPSVPKHILEKLLYDEWENVQEIAKKRISEI